MTTMIAENLNVSLPRARPGRIHISRNRRDLDTIDEKVGPGSPTVAGLSTSGDRQRVTAMRRHSMLARLLYALLAAFFSVLVFLAWLMFTMVVLDKRNGPLVILAAALLPVVLYLILSLAERFDAAPEPAEDDPLTGSAAMADWRLCDPMLSTFGVWRAEVVRYPADIADFQNARLVHEYVRQLVRLWSIRSAWPCEVERVCRENLRNPPSIYHWRVYRVILVDQWDKIRRGRFRFGVGYVEFQVETVRPEELPSNERVVIEESKQLVTAELFNAHTQPTVDPLWDRWLDG
jgi:hypothetical protein